MAQIGQTLIPIFSDMDTSESYIKSDKAFFLKGISPERQSSNTEGDLKPKEGNYLYCSVALPEGENICIGAYEYLEEKQVYIVVLNSEGNHLVYRISANVSQCQIVYRFCKDFPGIVNDPRYWFSEGRIAIKSIERFKPDGTKEIYKEMHLVNKKVKNIRIVIEDSIATNSFTTPFFTSNNSCCGPICREIQLGVPVPNDKIEIEPISPNVDDLKKQNRLFQKMVKFRFKHVNVWGQVSEHGIISDPYRGNLSGCSLDASGQPHCVWVKTKKPCPDIAKIIVEVSVCQSQKAVSDTVFSTWGEYLTIDLYDQTNPLLNWWERVYDTNNPNFELYNNGEDIRIKYCADKECNKIALSDIRDQNPVPFTSGTVANMGKGLVFGDNELGFNKIPKEDLDKITFEKVLAADCKQKYSRVVVDVVVHNFQTGLNNPVYKRNDIWGFGGFGKFLNNQPSPTYSDMNKTFAPETGFNEDGGYGQIFPKGVKGFRATLSSGHQCESKQYIIKGNSAPELVDYIGETQNLDDIKNYVASNLYHGNVMIQRFDFGMVPCGNLVFRVHSHNDVDNLPLQDTSTYYVYNTSYLNYKSNYSVASQKSREMIIDTTDGLDFNSIEKNIIGVIADMADPNGINCVIKGYMFESLDGMQPIELAEVKENKSVNGKWVVSSEFTDHNGFYFYGIRRNLQIKFKAQIFGSQKCLFNQLIGETPEKSNGGVTLAPHLSAELKFPGFSTGLCNRYYIEGTIKECGSNAGISGIPVTLARTKTVFTNSRGEFRVLAHYSNGRGSDKLIVSPSALCNIVDCNCGIINISLMVAQPLCGLPCVGSVVIDAGNFSLKSIVNSGFEHGSRIAIGVAGYDNVRRSDIQAKNDWFIDFASEQELKSSSYEKLRVKLPETFSPAVCSQFNRLVFSFSPNLNNSSFLTWAADKVEFIDSAGNVNANVPSKVKIWYRSLNEYNKLRGFNTNTAWSFQSELKENGVAVLGVDGAPVYNTVLGDIVEFIQDVNGVYLQPGLQSIVEHDKEGTYFLIDFDDSLRVLKDGVKFKLKRPYECETKIPYYEFHYPIYLCGNDCRPRDAAGNIITEFILDGFNSYMLPRQIPVVTTVIEQVPATGGGTQDSITTVKTIKSYPFTFEHHSPSDTWGYKCSNAGRINYKNPYEGKKSNRNQLVLTGALNQANDGAINYLHYFSFADDFFIDEQGWGGIQAIIIRDDGKIMLICEQTVFSLAYDDNRAVVTAEGYVALPSNKRFSKPDRDDSFNFGCQAKDLNTIRRNGPLVMFLDSQRAAVVYHNFASAVDVSEGVRSWLVPSIKEVQKNPLMYWHGNFDYRANKYLLTKFNLEKPEYVNQALSTDVKLNETHTYSLVDKFWTEMLHYTPEYFAALRGEDQDTQLFMFKNGIAYAQYSSVPRPYLNYFGVQCIPVFGIVTNIDPNKSKSFLWNDIYCRGIKWVVVKITTSMGQESSIPPDEWEEGEGLWSAAYLCDILNKDACSDDDGDLLMDGDPLYGTWLRALYVPEDYAGEFFRLISIISWVEPRDKSGK